MRFLFSFVYWCLTAVIFLGAMALTYLGHRLRSARLVVAVAQLWGRAQLMLTGATIRVTGLENVPLEGGCLFVANHRSYFDIFLIHATCPRVLRWVVKQALLHYPLLGWHLKSAGAVALEREKSQSAARQILKVARDLKKGDCVVVFPEGTRSESDAMLPFKSGVFALAQRSQVPIVPVAIWRTAQALAPRRLWVKPGVSLEIHYLPPLEPSDFPSDRGDLMQAVRSRLEEALHRERNMV